jgi:hypothetical protein
MSKVPAVPDIENVSPTLLMGDVIILGAYGSPLDLGEFTFAFNWSLRPLTFFARRRLLLLLLELEL